MVPRMLRFALPLIFLPAGCLLDEPKTALVPTNPFGSAPPMPPATRANYAPASTDVAAHVDTIGRQLIAANKEIGLQPQFRTIGTPQLEVFHQGTSEVLITEGLAKQCTTDGQLAAILSRELARMVAERESLAGPDMRRPERLPPMEVRIGNDNGAGFGPAPDQTYLAELGKFEKDRRNMNQPLTTPDPDALARAYLTRAGFAPAELDEVQPTLKAAAENATFARQLKAAPSPQARNWTR